MTTLTINDLQQNRELDAQAMTSIRGGYTAMTNSLVTTMGPYRKLKSHQPSLYPNVFNKKTLNNYNNQLNLALGSAHVSQSNNNSVTQY